MLRERIEELLGVDARLTHIAGVNEQDVVVSMKKGMRFNSGSGCNE